MKQWPLSELIDTVENELRKMGYPRKAIYQYRSLGFTPIKRYYESIAKLVYSEEVTQEYVDKAQIEAESGTMYDAKRKMIRKAAVILAEYAKTGEIIWRALPRWKTRQLTEPFAKCLEKYEHKLYEDGRPATTVRSRKPVAKHFLHYLEGNGIFRISQISRDDVLAYLPTLAEKYTRMGEALSVLRPFLSFLYTEDLLSEDFTSLLRVSAAQHRKYYDGFEKHETEKILSAADRNTVCGKRDYAIMMFAAHTGLRAIDVLSLKFGDIDWNARELRIVQHKTEKALTLPLNIAVCNAVADYILNGRPDCDSLHIFLRTRRPYRKLESWSGYSIVKRTAAKAEITWSAEDHKGFHSFRRSLGNWMLEAEIPLSTISEVLGHANVDSSKPYIQTHHSKLAMCALPLQGIEVTRRELL